MQKTAVIALFFPKTRKTSLLWEQREQRIMVVWRRLRHGINFIFSKEFEFFKILAFWAFWRPNMHTLWYWGSYSISYVVICTRISPIPWRCIVAEKSPFRLLPRNELLKTVREHHFANLCARVCSNSTHDRRCGCPYILDSSTANEIWIDFFKKVDFLKKSSKLYQQREQRIRVVWRR